MLEKTQKYIELLKADSVSGAVGHNGEIYTVGPKESNFTSFKDFITYQLNEMGTGNFCQRCNTEEDVIIVLIQYSAESSDIWFNCAKKYFNGWEVRESVKG